MHLEEYLDRLGLFGIKLGLEQTEELARRVGTPQKNLRFCHIAGSNGKGSCGAMLERVLRSAGFRTGFYTSPHLCRLGERFRIDGKALPEEELEREAVPVIAASEVMHQDGRCPTFFELTTVLALVCFAKHKVDFVIWETGMGGRFDATNIIDPLLSIITNVTLEHTQYLGNTVAAIAKEKAGIIKPGRPVFCGPMHEEAQSVIRRTAEAQNAPCFEAPDIGFFGYRHTEEGALQELEYDGHKVSLALPGPMQRDNFRTVAPALAFLDKTFGFDLNQAFAGLSAVRWPGRTQYIPRRRLIVDGGHNPDGMAKLAGTLQELFPGEKFTVILGSFADKDTRSVLKEALPFAAEFVFTPLRAKGRKSRSPQELCALLQEIASGFPAQTAENAASALRKAAERQHRMVSAGSLFLAGEVLELTGEQLCLEEL